jgi:predicted nucleic-acid-binding Zn-ribbon protein/peroxiredoxin
MVAQPIPDASPPPLAPDVQVTVADGTSMPLPSLWADRPLVLVFLPPWESPFNLDNAAQLRDHADLFDDAEVIVAAVCDVTATEAHQFGDANNLGFTLIADADGALRAAFSVADHASPARGGCATFIIDTGGTVRYQHRGAEPDDYPAVWTLITEACAITGADVEPPPLPKHVPVPPSLTAIAPETGNAPGTPFIGAGNHRMLKAGFSCSKCGFAEYEVMTVSTASGFLSRIFNFQHRKFTAVTCTRCTYTDLYKTDASALANVFDLLAGR